MSRANHQPQRLLLATDLSARCDRALDRSAQLAKQWAAELVALNVQEFLATPDQALAWARRASESDLRNLALKELKRLTRDISVPLSLRVEKGDAAHDVIHQVANEVNANVIVTSAARDEYLGRFWLGSNVDALAKTVAQPLLVVRQPGRRAYQRIVLATTLSDSTVFRLRTLVDWFPEARIDLFHTEEPPMGAGHGSQASQQASKFVSAACDHLLAQAGYAQLPNLSVVCVRGHLNDTLPAYVREHDVDLVVMGAPKSESLVDQIWRSPALDVLKCFSADALLIKAN